MNRQKLLDVVAAVETVPEEQFQMGFWWSECETTGCAIGHYCHQHPEEKLYIAKCNKYEIHGSPALRRSKARHVFAITKHFDISYGEASDLFYYTANLNKEQFLAKLLKFIGEKPATVLSQPELVTV